MKNLFLAGVFALAGCSNLATKADLKALAEIQDKNTLTIANAVTILDKRTEKLKLKEEAPRGDKPLIAVTQ